LVRSGLTSMSMTLCSVSYCSTGLSFQPPTTSTKRTGGQECAGDPIHWRRMNQLRELVELLPWDEDLCVDWQARWNKLRELGQNVENLAYGATAATIAFRAWDDIQGHLWHKRRSDPRYPSVVYTTLVGAVPRSSPGPGQRCSARTFCSACRASLPEVWRSTVGHGKPTSSTPRTSRSMLAPMILGGNPHRSVHRNLLPEIRSTSLPRQADLDAGVCGGAAEAPGLVVDDAEDLVPADSAHQRGPVGSGRIGSRETPHECGGRTTHGPPRVVTPRGRPPRPPRTCPCQPRSGSARPKAPSAPPGRSPRSPGKRQPWRRWERP
jgi:hypothetical protein